IGGPKPGRRDCIAFRDVSGGYEFIKSRPVGATSDEVSRVVIEIEAERARVSVGDGSLKEKTLPLNSLCGLSFWSHLGPNLVKDLVVEAKPDPRSLRRLTITAAARRHQLRRADLYRPNQAHLGAVEAVIASIHHHHDLAIEARLVALVNSKPSSGPTLGAETLRRFESAARTLKAQARLRSPDGKEIEEAIATMSEIYDETGSPAEMAYVLARRLSELGRPEDAIALLGSSLERHASDASSRGALTLLQLSLGHLDLAEAELKAWEKLERQAPAPMIVDALLKMGSARFDVALPIAERAAKRFDDPTLGILIETLRRLEAGPFGGRRTRIESDHYVVETDLPKPEAKAVVDRLERFRSVLEQEFPLAASERLPSRIWLFTSVESFRSFANALAPTSENALGFYVPTINTLLFFATLDDQRDERVLHHEAFHQYLDRVRRHAPIWLNEGMAEYFAATSFEDGSHQTGGIQEGRLIVLHRALARNEVPPLSYLVQMSPQRFMDGRSAPRNYAQSWAAVHFFRSGTHSMAKGAFERYVAAVLAGASSSNAWRDSFATLEDWEGVEDAWRRHVGRLHDELQSGKEAR
ncbi:MAG: DUF1570 domain-containing protein, partial [Planctomycetes bacterium]|nr:DUF1570 domain-containing protein [Planctomycetota bacterium]